MARERIVCRACWNVWKNKTVCCRDKYCPRCGAEVLIGRRTFSSIVLKLKEISLELEKDVRLSRGQYCERIALLKLLFLGLDDKRSNEVLTILIKMADDWDPNKTDIHFHVEKELVKLR